MGQYKDPRPQFQVAQSDTIKEITLKKNFNGRGFFLRGGREEDALKEEEDQVYFDSTDICIILSLIIIIIIITLTLIIITVIINQVLEHEHLDPGHIHSYNTARHAGLPIIIS